MPARAVGGLACPSWTPSSLARACPRPPARSNARSGCSPTSPRTRPARCPPAPAAPGSRRAPRCGCCAPSRRPDSSSARRPAPIDPATGWSSSAPWRWPPAARPARSVRACSASSSAPVSRPTSSSAAPADTAIYLAMVEGTHAIRHTSWVGRAIELEDLAVAGALRGDVSAHGYVAQRDRLEPDVTAIAAPIRWAGGIAGALNLLGPTYRIDDATMHAYGADRRPRSRRDQRAARRRHPITRPWRRPGDPVRVRHQALPRRHGRRRRAVHRSPDRQDHRLRRSVRVRQDHVAAHDQPDDRADVGPHHARRQGHRQDRSRPAAPRHRLRDPARRAVPAPHRRRQRRDRPAAARRGQGRPRASARWSCSSGSGCRRTSPSGIRPSCPAGSSSASASRAPSPPTRP